MEAVAKSRESAGRWSFLAFSLLFVWLGRESDGATWWYAIEGGPLPVPYIVAGLALVAITPAVFSTPRVSVVERLRLNRLGGWTAAGWTTIFLALAYGLVTGATELFADWRNLALFAAVAMYTTRWLSTKDWGSTALLDLATAMGVLNSFYLVQWALGTGVAIFGVRATVFYGPLLYMSIFSTATCGYTWIRGLQSFSPTQRALIRAATIVSALVVILSFRRSFWLALAVTIVTLFVIELRRRESSRKRLVAASVGAFLLVSAGFVFLGTDNMVGRLESFSPSSENEFSTSNAFHVNDLADAMDVILKEPLLGHGIGRHYQTQRIAYWKTQSFQVHNTPLHVWLKFGLMGLITYTGFHLAWIRSSLRVPSGRTRTLYTAAAAYLIGESAATLVGTWPYGSFQVSILHGLLLGGLLSLTVPSRREARMLSTA